MNIIIPETQSEYPTACRRMGMWPPLIRLTSWITEQQQYQRLDRPDRPLSIAVDTFSPTELLFSFIPRINRFVSVEVDLLDFHMQHFRHRELAEVALLTLSTMHKLRPPNQPLFVSIDPKHSFDPRIPQKTLTAAVEGKDGSYSFLRINSENSTVFDVPLVAPEQVQIVVRYSKTNGLTPSKTLKRFSGAYCFLENSINGLQMEFDHMVADGTVMQMLLRSLIVGVPLTMMPLPINVTDRVTNMILVPNIGQQTRTSAVLKQIQNAVNALTHSERGIVLINAIKQIAEESPSKLGRIVPIPVPSDEVLAAFDVESEHYVFRAEGMQNTPLGVIAEQMKLGNYPRSLLRFALRASSRIPGRLFPISPTALISFAPTIPSELPEFVKIENPKIGERVLSVKAELNMFPKSWGPVVITKASILFPGRDDPLTTYTLSGKTQLSLRSFGQKMEQ